MTSLEQIELWHQLNGKSASENFRDIHRKRQIEYEQMRKKHLEETKEEPYEIVIRSEVKSK